MKTIDIEIKDDEFYSLGKIVSLKLIRGVDTIPKASRLVNNPAIRKILKPRMVKRGERGVQYKVEGINIKQYLQHEKESKKGKEKKHVS